MVGRFRCAGCSKRISFPQGVCGKCQKNDRRRREQKKKALLS